MSFNNIYKKPKDKALIRDAANISSEILSKIRKEVKVGVNAKELDKFVGELCKKAGVVSSFKGVPGPRVDFPANSCIMINDEVIHAIPDDTKFSESDIVMVDFGIEYKGFKTDHCFTKSLSNSEEHKRIISTVELSVDTAILQALPQNRTGDISHAIQTITELSGYKSIFGYGGHGIGKKLHMDPHIHFRGIPETGDQLQENMVICIENWISSTAHARLEEDGWTLKTADGSIGAGAEEMVLITKDGPEVLTWRDR